jgi:outer membrane lipoprotein-sorting protein
MRRMNRRALLTGLALLPLAPLAAHAQAPVALTPQDEADLARITAYLNSIHTLKARFLQIAPNGQQSEGTAWLDRPGRMRFQYDPPSPFLLVAGHGMLVFHDSALDQTTNIPLGSTPLGLLLGPTVRLQGGGSTIIAFHHVTGVIQVSVIRTGRADQGNLSLVFADQPLALRRWILVDPQRRETTVSLFDVQLGGTFPQDLFTYIDPKSLAPAGGSHG